MDRGQGNHQDDSPIMHTVNRSGPLPMDSIRLHSPGAQPLTKEKQHLPDGTRDTSIGFSPHSANESHKQFKDHRKSAPSVFHFAALVCCCLLAPLCYNTVLLYMNKQCGRVSVLPNGDMVVACQDSDPSCFDVVDRSGRTVYRSNGRFRSMNLSPCSADAPRSLDEICLGEILFSHNATLLWYQRLYRNIRDQSLSLVSGARTENGDVRGDIKVRHMLSEPYNWVLGYDALPPNTHPQYDIYVQGTVRADQCTTLQ